MTDPIYLPFTCRKSKTVKDFGPCQPACTQIYILVIDEHSASCDIITGNSSAKYERDNKKIRYQR